MLDIPEIPFPVSNYFAINEKNIKGIKDEVVYGDLIELKTFINNDDGIRMLCKFKKGFKLQKHTHEGRYELYVISGKFRYTNPETGEEAILTPGSYYVNPPNVVHEDECLEDGEMFWFYNKKHDHTDCC